MKFKRAGPLATEKQIFAVILLLAKINMVTCVLGGFARTIIRNRLRTKLQLHGQQGFVSSLAKRCIVYNFNHANQRVTVRFTTRGISFVVISYSSTSVRLTRDFNCVAFRNSTARSRILLQINVRQTQYLITTLPSSTRGLCAILSTGALTPDVHAVTHTDDRRTVRGVRQNKTSIIISPCVAKNGQVTTTTLHPRIMSFLSNVLAKTSHAICIRRFLLAPGAYPVVNGALGRTRLNGRSKTLVLTVHHTSSALVVNPDTSAHLCPNSLIVDVNTTRRLHLLDRLLDPVQT